MTGEGGLRLVWDGESETRCRVGGRGVLVPVFVFDGLWVVVFLSTYTYSSSVYPVMSPVVGRAHRRSYLRCGARLDVFGRLTCRPREMYLRSRRLCRLADDTRPTRSPHSSAHPTPSDWGSGPLETLHYPYATDLTRPPIQCLNSFV